MTSKEYQMEKGGDRVALQWRLTKLPQPVDKVNTKHGNSCF